MSHATQGAAAPVSLPTELIVILSVPGVAHFYGTRAMLEAEGVLPLAMLWPSGFNCARWTAGRFKFVLCRTRPRGAKGPRSAFADVDWWHLMWTARQACKEVQQ